MDKAKLMLSAYRGRLGELQPLLDSGMDVNTQDNLGETPLNWAVYGHRLKTVKFLLEHGADPNIQDAMHWNAFDWATYKKDQDVNELLGGGNKFKYIHSKGQYAPAVETDKRINEGLKRLKKNIETLTEKVKEMRGSLLHRPPHFYSNFQVNKMIVDTKPYKERELVKARVQQLKTLKSIVGNIAYYSKYLLSKNKKKTLDATVEAIYGEHLSFKKLDALGAVFNNTQHYSYGIGTGSSKMYNNIKNLYTKEEFRKIAGLAFDRKIQVSLENLSENKWQEPDKQADDTLEP